MDVNVIESGALHDDGLEDAPELDPVLLLLEALLLVLVLLELEGEGAEGEGLLKDLLLGLRAGGEAVDDVVLAVPTELVLER